ncbi:hypothetical protein B0H15DRAFT_383134 [Mycena belliarum]|uniref:Uncharacterized protein n=1 Tax=Mycena belliarum TaxID=1033014 RepID=A0AAD6U4V7_9AGAR|nr:hypothetical protein B0H15DRAFT_383134 [Mycena belliae]
MGISFLLNSPAAAPHFVQYNLHPADGTQAHQEGLITGFMFLQIFGGHLGIPLVLLTAAVSKKVQRHPMLINFCVTWFIYATSFTLLLYSGKQTGPEPPRQLCIIQSAFIYGTPVMTAMAGLSFVIHLWLSLQKGGTRRWQMFLLLASPYIMFLGFSVAMIVLGSMYPETVSRSRYLFYCTINLAVVNAVPGTSALIMGVVLIFEILVGIKLYRHSKAFKAMDRTGTNTPPFHLFVRMGVFSGYSLLALVACIAFWSSSGDNLPYFIQASLPTAAFLIFGTQRVRSNTFALFIPLKHAHLIGHSASMANYYSGVVPFGCYLAIPALEGVPHGYAGCVSYHDCGTAQHHGSHSIPIYQQRCCSSYSHSSRERYPDGLNCTLALSTLSSFDMITFVLSLPAKINSVLHWVPFQRIDPGAAMPGSSVMI